MSIAVIGAGAWGTALAAVAAREGQAVLLHGRDGAQIADMARTHRNDRYLPGIDLPASLHPTADLAAAASADVVVIAIPTQALRSTARALAPLVRADAAVVVAAKGIEQGSGRFVTDILREEGVRGHAAILSGPSFAVDVARGLPTAVTLAADDLGAAERLAEALSGPAFRIYHSDDVRGVEIGGAAKNVLAIAAGIVAGASLGESARAALVARGFAELRRFAAAHGARPETLMGLSGLGDLVLSASSPQSRNFAYGLALGRGAALAEAAGGKLAEGAFTAPALVSAARMKSVEMPICEAVAAVVAGKVSVRQAIAGLIERPRRAE